MKAMQACGDSCLGCVSKAHATFQACDMVLAKPNCIEAVVCISSAKLSAPAPCA